MIRHLLYYIFNAILYYYYKICHNEIINTHIIADKIGGSWIRSAKNSEYDHLNNMLCADLRIGFLGNDNTYKLNENNIQYHYFRNYIYKRDCIIINPNDGIKLENNNGKFAKETNAIVSENIIVRVSGLEKYTIEYFPGPSLCIKETYNKAQQYCCMLDKITQEFCVDYSNDIKHIIFDHNHIGFETFKSHNEYLKTKYRSIT